MSFLGAAFKSESVGVTLVTGLGALLAGGYMSYLMYSHNDVSLLKKQSPLKTTQVTSPTFIDKDSSKKVYDAWYKQQH